MKQRKLDGRQMTSQIPKGSKAEGSATPSIFGSEFGRPASLVLFAIAQSTLSSRQAHRHPFSAGAFAVHAMGRDRSRAFQEI